MSSHNFPSETEVVVVGAGPAGLAVASCLQHKSIPHVILEKAHSTVPAWRNHYVRLHLHTNRALSGLPYFPMPHHFPKYPSRDQVVNYLDEYAALNWLDPFFNVTVESIKKENGCWITTSSAGKITSRAVVVATGYYGEPILPHWPGLDDFPGVVLHSRDYRNVDPFSNQDVLIVGFGNSGGEIALDLLERGARPTISVRSPVNIIPRDVLGIPILAIALVLSKLPPGLADALSWPLLKMYYPSYQRLGLRKAACGPFVQISRNQKIPVLDIGTIRKIRSGHIQVVDEIREIRGCVIAFSNGVEKAFQAIVLATGFQPGSKSILPKGSDIMNGSKVTVETGLPGLFLCGFNVSPT
ncbi:MAG: flavin-containing monooxygenase, partial [Nitrospirales bacterium]